MDDPLLLHDWHPVAASSGIATGGITQALLLDREVALWRGPDAELHAWEDRCPHRGTRLSIGGVDGNGLVCAYHGWRFAADGACTGMPTDPKLKPSHNIRAATYRVKERYGLSLGCA